MTFDWGAAWKSLLPIAVFAVGMGVVYLIVGLMTWIEDNIGIPVPVMVVVLICFIMFLLSGWGGLK